MDAHQVVATVGLKPLFQDHVMLGIIAADELKADDFDRLHQLATSDVRKLVLRMKEGGDKVCAVMYFDGNPVNAMVATLLKGNGIPIQYITSMSPTLANDKTIWYADNWKKTFLESCSLVLNYGNTELSEYAEENAVENVDVMDRPFRPQGIMHQDLTSQADPYGEYWAQVKDRLRIQRIAWQGIRINQIIDLRPPKLF